MEIIFSDQTKTVMVPVFHPKVKKVLQHAERRILKLTGNKDLTLVVLNHSEKPLPYEDIERIVCEVTGIPIYKAIKKRRDHELAVTRHLISFFARTFCRMGYRSIADKLNRTDHTTIISSIRRITMLIDSGNSEVCELVYEINNRIEQLKKSA